MTLSNQQSISAANAMLRSHHRQRSSRVTGDVRTEDCERRSEQPVEHADAAITVQNENFSGTQGHHSLFQCHRQRVCIVQGQDDRKAGAFERRPCGRCSAVCEPVAAQPPTHRSDQSILSNRCVPPALSSSSHFPLSLLPRRPVRRPCPTGASFTSGGRRKGAANV
jgi:hypothetical protein